MLEFCKLLDGLEQDEIGSLRGLKHASQVFTNIIRRRSVMKQIVNAVLQKTDARSS